MLTKANDMLFPECSPGTFGENCNGQCRCDGGSPCDPVSGRCPGECEEGYEGETCSMKSKGYNNDNNYGVRYE